MPQKPQPGNGFHLVLLPTEELECESNRAEQLGNHLGGHLRERLGQHLREHLGERLGKHLGDHLEEHLANAWQWTPVPQGHAQGPPFPPVEVLYTCLYVCMSVHVCVHVCVLISGFSFNSFIVKGSEYQKIHLFKVYNSMFFSIFTRLCKYPHNQCENIFVPLKSTASPLPPPPGPGSSLSISTVLPVLDIHITRDLWSLTSFRSIMFWVRPHCGLCQDPVLSQTE